MRESFVKSFFERLAILESLTKKCESILASDTKRSKCHPDEEYKEKLLFLENHANQLRRREEILATRESEVGVLRAQVESQLLQFETKIRSREEQVKRSHDELVSSREQLSKSVN